jgi:hypothetical protein
MSQYVFEHYISTSAVPKTCMRNLINIRSAVLDISRADRHKADMIKKKRKTGRMEEGTGREGVPSS